MNLNQLKLGARLSLGFGAVLALSVVMVAIAFFRLASISTELGLAQEFERRAGVMPEWMGKTDMNVIRALAIAKSTGLPAVEAHFAPQMKETSTQISALQKDLEPVITSERGKALLAEIGEKRTAYIDIRKQVGTQINQGDPLAAEKTLNEKMMPAASAYLEAMKRLSSYQAELAKKNIDGVHSSIATAKMVLLGMLLASLGVGAAMAWTITRSVTRPLHDAVAAAEVIARGDLTQSVGSSARDELGELLRALGRMQESLRTLVGQVRPSTDSIGTASVQIASGNQDLSARTETAASNLQQTASSIEQLAGAVGQSADSARQANQLAASAAEVAQRGGSVVSQVVSTMDEINASSKKIADIIGVIDGIAFQTNILALNAAVEAAREIKGLIGASVDKVETGSKLVADAGSTMNEIVASVQRVSDIIGEITAAAAEQSDGIGQVNTAVTQLDQMTQQNAALVEQSAAAAESLKEQALRLNQVVGTFRVETSAFA
ncbi:methyl-accepting chemotaxis protein [uncultured Piscinibacter sp.]|uniref:methyl-accepting chemotaxis protein n=1 Tax=uncultured Piscinibacter sp. TaxID=1131835 RepID=UPI00262BF65D|nr:methyl-accepting chemotaxis protein [uncultured Piscinibacter sp.]